MPFGVSGIERVKSFLLKLSLKVQKPCPILILKKLLILSIACLAITITQIVFLSQLQQLSHHLLGGIISFGRKHYSLCVCGGGGGGGGGGGQAVSPLPPDRTVV